MNALYQSLPDDVDRNRIADMGAPLSCSDPDCFEERNSCCEDDCCPACCAKHDDGACIDCSQIIRLDQLAAHADEQIDAYKQAAS